MPTVAGVVENDVDKYVDDVALDVLTNEGNVMNEYKYRQWLDGWRHTGQVENLATRELLHKLSII